MSSLETESEFRRKSLVNATIEPDFVEGSASQFNLITDHQTMKHKSREHLLDDGPAKQSCCSAARRLFRRKMLFKRLPILKWLPQYTPADAIGDLIAGLTVGMTVIPQGLAYSSVAGLPTQYGLYGTFFGSLIYVLFGTCRVSTMGSTAIASLMIFQFTQGVWQRAVLLTFLTGFIELFMALFKLGFLVDFVSGPVSAGFTSAVALIISTSQVKNILGINSDGDSFLQKWISMIEDYRSIHVADTILGIGCLVVLVALRYLGLVRVGPRDARLQSTRQRLINKAIWFVSVTRNALVVTVALLVNAHLWRQDKKYFVTTGYIPAGLPTPQLPPFSIPGTPGNATLGIPEVKGESFTEMIGHMGYGLVIVPIVGLLENIAVCKAFARGEPVDATQELIALGLANIGNSFFQGYRANGGLARTAVNCASGAKTPLSNLYIAGTVVFALMYLTEYCYYIPKAVLGAVIMSAVIFQVQYHVIVPMWRSKRIDLIPGLVSFIACLILPLQIGILSAIGFNLLFILFHSARPKIAIETLETPRGQQFLKVTPDRCLIFPSVEFVRNIVLKYCNQTPLPVVLDCTYIYGADYTAAKVMSSMVEDFKRRHQKLIFFNLKPSVVHIFEGLQTQFVVCYNITSLCQKLGDDDSHVLPGP